MTHGNEERAPASDRLLRADLPSKRQPLGVVRVPAADALIKRQVVIYCRQSKDSGGTGLAVARQLEACEELAARRGWTVSRVFVDNDVSASSRKPRPAYTEMIGMAEAGDIGTIICWAVDRLTRRLTDLEDVIEKCERYKLKVCTVDGDIDLSTDSGRLIGRILASVARGEVERKSARQRLETDQAAEAGTVPRRRAFGYNQDGTVHDVEGPALRELYGLLIGGMSTLAGTRWLNGRGLRTTYGKEWQRSSVAAMIRNPRNCGYRTLRGITVAVGQWEPIVDEATWRAAVDRSTGKATGTRTGRRHLGTGTYFCHCGAKVKVNYSQHGKRVYECRQSRHLSRSADPIDKYVEREMVRLLSDQTRLAELLAPNDVGDMAKLRDAKTGLRLRSDQLGVAIAKGQLTGRQVQVATAELDAERDDLDRQLAELGRASRFADLVAADDPGRYWVGLDDLSTRQAMLNAVMRVTLHRGTPGRSPFDPATVVIDPVTPVAS